MSYIPLNPDNMPRPLPGPMVDFSADFKPHGKCLAERDGLQCDLEAGHAGKHTEVDSWDEYGRPDGGITWADDVVPVVLQTDEW